jgi:cell shape-determining protein MreC
MSALRFHHVFFVLMLLALASAFALDPETSQKLAPRVETLFAPIAKPLRSIGPAIDRRWGAPEAVDQRSDVVIREENERLRLANATLKAQLDELKIIIANQDSLGEVGKDSRPYKVITVDAGNREAISIGGSTLQGIADNQPVIYQGGLAGRTLRAGVTSTSILLITDRDAKPMTANFGRYQVDKDGQTASFVRLNDAAVLVRGAGSNTLVADLMTLKDADAAGIRVGDLCVLADPLWPTNLQGYPIGKVISKSPRPDSPLYARIVIEPSKKLRLLPEVSVVLK